MTSWCSWRLLYSLLLYFLGNGALTYATPKVSLSTSSTLIFLILWLKNGWISRTHSCLQQKATILHLHWKWLFILHFFFCTPFQQWCRLIEMFFLWVVTANSFYSQNSISKIYASEKYLWQALWAIFLWDNKLESKATMRYLQAQC